MERESFENEDIAKILNENFVPVKVDRCVESRTRWRPQARACNRTLTRAKREERPDINRIYMNFVSRPTRAGGSQLLMPHPAQRSRRLRAPGKGPPPPSVGVPSGPLTETVAGL